MRNDFKGGSYDPFETILRCKNCGEHCFECRCIDESISNDIQSKIAPIYEKYKDHPNELMDAFEFFMEAIDNDQCARFLCNYRYPTEKKGLQAGYICRVCSTSKGAVPPKDHVCTWHKGKCDFCPEIAMLCHTSDWNWPGNECLEEGRET